MDTCFSANYEAAREKFLAASRAVGATVRSYPLRERGPMGGELATDIAWLGPTDAARALVTISGTHGVEGFFGSATQIEWLRRAEKRSLPQDIGILHVHAINPFGFAWLRRTNEQNIDINRNWIDFGGPLPENPLYDELAEDLCPDDWSYATQTRTGKRIAAWIQRHGMARFQQAVSGGQWKHPSGLFYGGAEPCWSRTTLTAILQSMLGHASRVSVIDFHTGLGAYGYAEPIIGRARTDPAFARTTAWIGAAAKSLYGDGSVSAEIRGDGLTALPALLPHAAVDAVALECGIRPMDEVAQALRADNWLHLHGDSRSPEAEPIKSSIRAAFHSDDAVWQGMALGQGLAACEAAIGGLRMTP